MQYIDNPICIAQHLNNRLHKPNFFSPRQYTYRGYRANEGGLTIQFRYWIQYWRDAVIQMAFCIVCGWKEWLGSGLGVVCVRGYKIASLWTYNGRRRVPVVPGSMDPVQPYCLCDHGENRIIEEFIASLRLKKSAWFMIVVLVRYW